jgi:hypothetical protein
MYLYICIFTFIYTPNHVRNENEIGIMMEPYAEPEVRDNSVISDL